MTGWVKMHRTVLEKGWSNKPDFVALWVYLLLQASHEKRECFWNGKSIVLKPGQFISGRSKMAAATGIHRSKLERILKCFESEQQIEQQTSTTSRLISITNYLKHQNVEQRSEQIVSSKRAASEQRVSTKQELKKERSNIKTRDESRAQKFVDFVNQTFSKKYRCTEKIKSQFAARIKNYEAGVLVNVVKNIKESSYHIDTGFKYATPEFLLREDKIEKYKSGPITQKPFTITNTEPQKGQKYDEETNIYSEFQ